MTKKQIAIYVVIFIAGLILAPKNPVVEKTIEVPQECPAVECNADTVKNQMIQLRDVDNQGFLLAGQAMNACSTMVKAAASFDADGIEEQTDIINGITTKFTSLSEERDQLLEEAGIPNK